MKTIIKGHFVDGLGSSFTGSVLAEYINDEYDIGSRKKYKILKIYRDNSFSNSQNLPIREYKTGIITPSFFDFHSHTEIYAYNNPTLPCRAKQKIFGEIVGNCGVSVYPFNQESKDVLFHSLGSILGEVPEKIKNWSKNEFYLCDFLSLMKRRNIQSNLKFLQGHSALRYFVMGNNSSRTADKNEILQMQKLLAKSFEDGAIGFSTGLYYAPCIYCDKSELLSLLEIVNEYNGLFAIHRREEGDGCIEATAEAIDLAKQSRVKLQISHLKAIGEKNQDKLKKCIELIEYAKKDGLDITFDTYPYTYGSTSVESMLPPDVLCINQKERQESFSDTNKKQHIIDEILNPCGWESIIHLVGFDKIYFVTCSSHPDWEGKSFSRLAKENNTSPFDIFFSSLYDGSSCVMKDFTQTRESLLLMYSNPLCLFSSDSLFVGNNWHKRSTEGIFKYFTLLKNYIPLEEIVAKATGYSYKRLGIEDGVIREGSVVDLVHIVV